MSLLQNTRCFWLWNVQEGGEVHLVRGRLAFASGRYQEAAEEFGATVEAVPRSARALVNLGTSLAQLGDLEGAVERLKQALDIDRRQTTAHFNLASILFIRNMAAEATPHFEVAVEDTPYDAEVHLLLARVRWRTEMTLLPSNTSGGPPSGSKRWLMRQSSTVPPKRWSRRGPTSITTWEVRPPGYADGLRFILINGLAGK